MEKIILLLSITSLFAGLTSSAQTKISGQVYSTEGNQTLAGVTVLVKGSHTGTITDALGKFSIAAKRGDTLVLTFLGYNKKEISADDKNVLHITLSATINDLNSVVVVGYGSQKKSDVTGAISSISTKALQEVPVTNITQMLQGRAAGMDVVAQGNKPGDGMSVRIRGRRSFNAGNDPLYVVDGIPITGGFNDINPSDIESIEVLKDASATAIYGSRGANGVIIVSTKRGKLGKTTVSYNSYYGVSHILKYPDIMNGAEFAEYKRESRRAVINPATGKPQYDDNDPEADQKLFEPVELESIAQGRSTNYPKMMIHNGHSQNHDLSVSGGSENTKFNVSLGYFNDVGIIPGQDFTRYTSRINIDQKISNRFTIGMSTLGSYSERNGKDVNPYGSGADFGALTENPLGIPYDDKGNLIFHPTSDGLRSNPLADIVPGAVINREKRFRLLSNVFGEANILNGLKFRMNFSPDLTEDRTGNFRGRYTNARNLGDPSASNSEYFTFAYTWENILTYKKVISQKHSIDITGLYSVQNSQEESSGIDVASLPVESLEYYNLGAASIINGVSSSYEKWSILSYMARINYVFDNRFLLTLTGRADGSSKFARGKHWGFFPSAALAWNIINEKFMVNNSLFSNLKFRISYGETGNEGIPPYQTDGLLTRTKYDFDGAAAFGYSPSSIRNNNLRWETTTTLNAGVDFSILNNRISGSLEVYQSKTTDLLLPMLLPITSGYNSILSNVGSKRNRGIEVSLSTINISSGNDNGFEWSTDLNLFTNKEEILELSQGKVDDVGNLRFIGYPSVVYYDYVKTGIWQLGQEKEAEKYSSIVGGIKVKDVNGNGVIDPNDRQILGTDVPKLIGGMTHRFKYKGVDLSVVTFARFGSMISSPIYGAFRFLSGRVNQYNVNYWTKNNPTNAFPEPNSSLETPLFGSTLQYFDGSFVKVRNISLGYTFPAHLASKIRAQSLRVYISVQNPFVFSPYTSKYNGMDPEDPTLSTPPSRLFLGGINVKF